MTSINVDAIGDYMDGIPSTGDLADAAASTPVSGGGFDFGKILKGGIQAGLDSLVGGLFGGGSKGGSKYSSMLAAGPAAFFDNELVERATERVQAETLKNLENLRRTLNDLANITGQSTPEFVNRLEGRYQNYIEPAAQRGFNLLTQAPGQFGPTLAGDTSFQRGIIDDYLESYSNLNRPTFMAQATNPTTVSMNMAELEDVAKSYMDMARSELGQGGLMNYQDAQSQELIKGQSVPGGRYSRESLQDFYGSPEIKKDFMTYSSY